MRAASPLGPELAFVGRTEVEAEGRRLAFFGGNDYHRFSTHPAVVQALCEGASRYGVSSGGSRVTTANHPLYGELERRLARFLNAEAVTLCACGYLANTAAVQAARGEFRRVLLEDAAHSSLQEAAVHAELPVTRFQSRRPEALESALRAGSGRALILCDGVAPSTGHVVPLSAYAELAAEYSSSLLVDDAHGVGTLGTAGRGTPEAAGIASPDLVQTGTLSKAFGCYGGWVAGSREVAEQLRSRSTAFMGATPLPLPIVAAALRAIDLLDEEAHRLPLLRERTQRVKEAALGAGFPVSPGDAPICSLTFGRTAEVDRFRTRLLERRLYPPFIQYPGAPAGGHFRFTLSSEHREEQVATLCEAIRYADRTEEA